ncbi:MAG: Bax inhibitor-1/YccA family protein, partial [Actinomycetota bacterium]|nr:Bax inhibitor-1/YccA family protein [Actinomycetota bacterium]
LLVLLVAAGAVGWNTVDVSPFGAVQFPGWAMLAVLGGLGLLVLSFFKPAWAKFIAPVYAIVQGLLVGAISHVYEYEFDGIVLQAAMLTVGIFAAMLFLYSTRIIKVTDRLRRGVIAATMGIMLVYAFQLLMRLIGTDVQVPFLHDSGPVGILISLVIVGVAAFNYLIDFDFVERAAKAGAPKDLEWTAALGLLVTTVWLYLELLRLLSKLRD